MAIEAGERATERLKLPAAIAKARKVRPNHARRSEKEIRKELKVVEKTIAQLDERKKEINAKYMDESDSAESLRLHAELAAVTQQLGEAEDRWGAIQAELEQAG